MSEDRTRASAAATGRALGVSDSAVLRAWKSGRISRNEDGTFDIEKVALQWQANTNPLRGGKRGQQLEAGAALGGPVPASITLGAGGGSPGMAAVLVAGGGSPGGAAPAVADSLRMNRARATREEYEAANAKLDYEQKVGTLINREGAERAVEAGFRLVRDMVMACPDRLPLDDATRILVRDTLRETLEAAAKAMPSTLADGAHGDR